MKYAVGLFILPDDVKSLAEARVIGIKNSDFARIAGITYCRIKLELQTFMLFLNFKSII
jgi:hypothetical protein